MHSLPPRHTHMYTHTRTHTYTHACTGMSTNTHTHTRMHTIHTRMCTQPQAAEPPLVAACQGRPPTPLRGSQRLQLGGRNPTLLHQPAARLRGRPGAERPPAPGLPAAPNLSTLQSGWFSWGGGGGRRGPPGAAGETMGSALGPENRPCWPACCPHTLLLSTHPTRADARGLSPCLLLGRARSSVAKEAGGPSWGALGSPRQPAA